jgi:hypothetical protein
MFSHGETFDAIKIGNYLNLHRSGLRRAVLEQIHAIILLLRLQIFHPSPDQYFVQIGWTRKILLKFIELLKKILD